MTANAKSVPEWAKRRATDLTREVCGYDITPAESHACEAFAAYIAAHESEPVDPLEKALREAFDDLKWGYLDEEVQLVLSRIELAGEQK